jgi:hypothetical protein
MLWGKISSGVVSLFKESERDREGHAIHLILFSCFQCVVSLQACTGALSSWKIYSSVGKWRAITGMRTDIAAYIGVNQSAGGL